MSCPVCIEDYKGKIKQVTCQYCPSNACRGCQQRYLLQTYEDPHCMECKRGWSSEFMAANFPLVFRNSTLRKQRRRILLEREKAMLPAIQIYVEYKKAAAAALVEENRIKILFGSHPMRIQQITAWEQSVSGRFEAMATKRRKIKYDLATIKDTLSALKAQEPRPKEAITAERQRRAIIREQEAALEPVWFAMNHEYQTMSVALTTAAHLRWRNQGLYDDIYTDGAPQARREFIMKCSDEGCRGFLSSAYKCGTCAKHTCTHCLVVLGEEAHVCNPDTVETAKTIRAETRPCPKCGTRIFKIDGCFAKDTPILLWSGSTKLSQDITIGDVLIGDDGNQRVVEELCSGEDELYEVSQKNGVSYTVNSKHKLALKFSGNKVIYWSDSDSSWKVRWIDLTNTMKSKMVRVDDVTTKERAFEQITHFKESIDTSDVVEIPVDEYMKLSDSTKKNLMGFKSSGMNWAKENVTLDPYILGLYLGDGINNGIDFAACPEKDPEIIQYLLDWCEQHDSELVHDDAYRFRVRQLLARSLGFIVNVDPNRDWLRTGIEVKPVGKGTYYGWSVSGNKRFVLSDTTVVRNCDQMWCVMNDCNTAFSWNSGHIVTGTVHNPHYYEWLRRTGGGAPDREVGDIPCGGLPTARVIARVVYAMEIDNDAKSTIMETHRCMRDLIDVRLRDYPARAPQLMNKDIDVAYLMNELTEEAWQRQLELSEAKFKRKKEIGQILQTLATAGSDIMNTFLQQAQTLDDVLYESWLMAEGFPELERLREFGNESLKALAKRDHMAVPQLEKNWEWKPLRALYRKAPLA